MLVNLKNTKENGKIIKNPREKRELTYKRIAVRMKDDLSTAILEARIQKNISSKS